MIKNVSKTEVEKLSDRNLQRAIIELTDELVFVHGYSSEDAAIFAQKETLQRNHVLKMPLCTIDLARKRG